MIYGYVRISTDKRPLENQEFEINNLCEKSKLKLIDGWQKPSAALKIKKKRKLGKILKNLRKMIF